MTFNGAHLAILFPAVLVASLLGSVPTQAQAPAADFSDVRDYIDKSIETMQEDLKNLPATTDASLLGVDQAVPAMVQSLEFSRAALAAGKVEAAMDALGVNIGIAEAVLDKLPAKEVPAARTPAEAAATIDLEEVNDLTPQDIENIKSVVTRMAKAEVVEIENVDAVFDRLGANGLNITELTDALSTIDLNQFDVVAAINHTSDALSSMDKLVGNLESIVGNAQWAGNIAGQLQNAGLDLNDLSRQLDSLQGAAEAIASAISEGIDVDLEAAAKGLGFDSFSDAVDAYNEAHGTNFSVQEAKEALGND
jgi:hypothetical protein